MPAARDGKRLSGGAVPCSTHESTAYPVFVQSTDADGNALGGIRHPLLAAPLATHVGWSLRATGYGEGELFTVQGSMIPFAQTEAERERARDPSRQPSAS